MKQLAVLPLLMMSLAASATVYKWTDKAGRVHYTDKPVANAETVQDKVATHLTAEQAADSAGKAQDKSAKQADCKAAQEQAELYGKAQRFIEKDSFGNEKEYDGKDKDKLIKMQQDKAQAACKGVYISSTPAPGAAPAAPAAAPQGPKVTTETAPAVPPPPKKGAE